MCRRILAAAAVLIFGLAASALAQTTDQAAALVKAATDGDTAAVERLLAAGVNPNSADNKGLTALNWAAYNGNVPVVRALLAHKAAVDSHSNPDAWTPLMNAANGGHNDVIALLLDAGAQINAKDKVGDAAVWYAATSNLRQTAALLKARGATDDVSRILLAYTLCTSARAPLLDASINWHMVQGRVNQASCDGVKHISPGNAGSIIMFTYQVAGDQNGAKTLSINVLIADNQLSKDLINKTLNPLLTDAFVASGRGPVPTALLNAVADLSNLQTDTALGRFTAKFKPSTDPRYPVVGTEYHIDIDLK